LTELAIQEILLDTPNPLADDEVAGLTTKSISPKRQAYLRFRKHKAASVSVVVLAILVITVILTPITARYGINTAAVNISKGNNEFLTPRKIAWFGTDDIGRDLYSRLLYGIKVSLIIGVSSAIISVLIGVVVGSVAGMRGGLIDDVMMRVTDIFLAFPILVSLLVMRNVLGGLTWLQTITGDKNSIRFLITLFVLFGWMTVARVVRAEVMSIKEREFVEASRAVGGKNGHIIVRHILPNAVGPILVALSLSVVGAIVAEVTLALFGYGPSVGSGATSLGLLIQTAPSNIISGRWWLVIFPFAALLIITLCISFIGDGLRDATDPKGTQGR
jgi:peptide/nickel transport system permease protein